MSRKIRLLISSATGAALVAGAGVAAANVPGHETHHGHPATAHVRHDPQLAAAQRELAAQRAQLHAAAVQLAQAQQRALQAEIAKARAEATARARGVALAAAAKQIKALEAKLVAAERAAKAAAGKPAQVKFVSIDPDRAAKFKDVDPTNDHRRCAGHHRDHNRWDRDGSHHHWHG